MVRTHNTANRLKLRTNNVATDVANLKYDIESFGEPEVKTYSIDATEEAQLAYKREYENFMRLLDEVDNDFTADAIDIHTKIELLKAAAAAINPSPHHKLRELDLIIEEITQKITQFQNIIASNYDKIVHTT